MYHNACMFFVCSRFWTVNKDLESESGDAPGAAPVGSGATARCVPAPAHLWPGASPARRIPGPVQANPRQDMNCCDGVRSVARLFTMAPGSAYPSAMPQTMTSSSSKPSSARTTLW